MIFRFQYNSDFRLHLLRILPLIATGLIFSAIVRAGSFEQITDYRQSEDLLVQQDDKNAIFYIVDGEPMSTKEVDKIDMENIEQIEYIKDKEKIKLYTDEDVDTVVLITMKKEEKEKK